MFTTTLTLRDALNSSTSHMIFIHSDTTAPGAMAAANAFTGLAGPNSNYEALYMWAKRNNPHQSSNVSHVFVGNNPAQMLANASAQGVMGQAGNDFINILPQVGFFGGLGQLAQVMQRQSGAIAYSASEYPSMSANISLVDVNSVTMNQPIIFGQPGAWTNTPVSSMLVEVIGHEELHHAVDSGAIRRVSFNPAPTALSANQRTALGLNHNDLVLQTTIGDFGVNDRRSGEEILTTALTNMAIRQVTGAQYRASYGTVWGTVLTPGMTPAQVTSMQNLQSYTLDLPGEPMGTTNSLPDPQPGSVYFLRPNGTLGVAAIPPGFGPTNVPLIINLPGTRGIGPRPFLNFVDGSLPHGNQSADHGSAGDPGKFAAYGIENADSSDSFNNLNKWSEIFTDISRRYRKGEVSRKQYWEVRKKKREAIEAAGGDARRDSPAGGFLAGLDDFFKDLKEALEGSKPIALDLDGDGVELRDSLSGVSYDWDKDGFAEATGWVAADDGMLVYDDGITDESLEGPITSEDVMLSRIADGVTEHELDGETVLKKNPTDFDGLARFDINQDGVLDDKDIGTIKVAAKGEWDAKANDGEGDWVRNADGQIVRSDIGKVITQGDLDGSGNESVVLEDMAVDFANFKVWQDLDQDGEVDVSDDEKKNELKTLEEWDIVSFGIGSFKDQLGTIKRLEADGAKAKGAGEVMVHVTADAVQNDRFWRKVGGKVLGGNYVV